MRFLGFLLLTLIFETGSAFAHPATQVVLLTSVNTSPEYFQKWEARFRAATANLQDEIVVRHQATQLDLWQTLQSPRTRGVFWLSHAGTSTPHVGLNIGTIQNGEGADVSSLFKSVGPHLRWMSVIGCKAKPIFDQYRNLGFYDQNSQLQLDADDTVVEASERLDLALARGIPILESHSELFVEDTLPAQSIVSKFIEVEVTRTSLQRSALIEARLELNGKVLAVFPATDSVETQSAVVQISEKDLASGSEQILELTTGLSSLGLRGIESLGVLAFKSHDPLQIEGPILNQAGKPIGRTRNLYRLKAHGSIQ